MNTKKLISRMAVALCALFFVQFTQSSALAQATVTTDKEDYPPYSVVWINGSGFQPGETVSNVVAQIAGPDAGAIYEGWNVVADTNGNFETDWLVFSDELLDTTLQLTSMGQTSGLTAQTTFTDAASDANNGSGTMTVSPTSVSAGSTGNSFTFSFRGPNNKTWNSGSQVTLVIPAGWTTPQIVSGPSSGFISTANAGNGAVTGISVGGTGPWTVTVTFSMATAATSATTDGFNLTYAGGGTKVTAPGSGSYTFTTQSGNSANSPSTPANIAAQPVVTVVGSPTTTTLASSQTPSIYGQSVTFTATVSGSGGTPTGTVTFKDGATTLGTGTLDGSGVATFNTTTLSASGSPHSITAVYGSDSTFATSTSSAVSQVVNKATLTVRPNAVSVSYSGTALNNTTYSDNTANYSITGFQNGETVATAGVTLSGSMAFNGSTSTSVRNVGTYSQAQGTLALSANNYLMSFSNPAPNNYVITQRAITVTAAANTKTYDGATTAATAPTISPALVGTDTSLFTDTYDNKNVGTGKTLTPGGTANDGNGGNNYSVTFVNSANGTINARAITVTAATNTKIYDATTSAAAIPTITTGSLAAGDSATWTEAYNNPNAGVGNKTLIPSGTVSDGNGGNNYTVTFANFTTGTINKRPLTVTAVTNTKPYDGTTSAAATPTITSGALQGTDTANFIESYANKNAGTGKTITPSGTVTDGNAGANYSYTFTSVTTGIITAQALTVGAVSNTKTYDGTTSAAATPTITSGAIQTGDTANFTEAYDTKNFGTGKTLTPSGTVTDGNSGLNYTYTFVPDTTGVINVRPITVTAALNSKAYDATTSAAATPTIAGGLGTGDTANFIETYDNKNVGTTKTLTPSGTVNDGNSGNNYSITFATSANGTITARALTVTASSTIKVYGATLTFGGTEFTTSGLQGGETVGSVALSSTGAAATAAPGSYTIVPSAATGGTFSASNYSVTYANGTLTVNKASTSTSVASSANPSCSGASVTFTATVTDSSPSSTGTPTGTVTFKDGATTLGTGTLNGSGVATFSTSTLSFSGSPHSITAVYGGDSNFTTSTSSALSQSVNDCTPPTTASVTTPAGSSFRAATVPAIFSGNAADNSGGAGLNANSTTFTLRRTSDGSYWSGSSWQVGAFNLAATHSATTSGTSAPWNDNVILPTWASETDGTYSVQATATDKSGNSFTGTANTFTLDNTAPSASVAAPADAAAYQVATMPTTFTGTAVDNTGGVGLNANTAATFTLRRASDNLFWSGTDWQGTAVNLTTTNAATTDGVPTTWGDNVTLPTWSSEGPGDFTVQPTATDKVGNSALGTPSTFTLVAPYVPVSIGTGVPADDEVAGTTLTISPVTAGVGNTIFVLFAMDPANGSVTVIDSKGNTYTQDKDVTNGSGTSGVRTLVFSARVTTALSGDTITITHPSAKARVANALMVDDLVVASWTDKAVSSTGNTSPMSVGPTATLSQPDELVIAAFGYESDAGSANFTHVGPYANTGPIAEGNNPGGAVSSGSGGGNDKTIHVSVGSEYQIVTATTALSATATIAKPNNYAAVLVTYKKQLPYVVVDGIVRANGNPACGNSVNFTVTFSEEVFGVNTSDFVLATSGVTGASVTGVTEAGPNGDTYTVTVNTGTGSGSVGLNLADNDSIFDIDATPLGGTGAGNGNFTGQVYTITKDPLVITCPSTQTITLNANCSATLPDYTTLASVSGGCGNSIVTQSPAPGTSLNGAGSLTVSLTAEDGNGNPANCGFTVNKVDNIAPVAPVIANATGECSVTVIAPTTTDNCVGTVTGTTVDPLTYSSQGTFTVHWSFNDGNGNTSTANQTVIVDDVTAPVAPTIANATGECSVTVTAPTTTDNCVGTVTGTTTDPLIYSSQGTFTVHWSFNDGNGNISTANQTVIVDDVTAPVAPTIANATGECSVTVTAPTTTDNCAGTVTGTTTDPLTYNTQGTFTVHWSFNDGNGNTSTANQTVIVDDVTAPAAPTIANATGECSVTVTAPTTTDNCVGTVTGTTTDPLIYSSQGTFTVHWSFNDGNGNISTANQTVIVDDVTAPVAPTIANATGECSVTVTAPTTTDNCAGTVTGTTTDPLTYNTQGTFTVHWSFNDGNGNTSTANQTVIVDDVTAPVAPTIANATGECSVTVTAPTTTDNCVGTVTGTTADPLTYNTQGTFTVHWSFDDGNGNSSTANQTVIVDDVTAPVAPTIANATGECSVTVTAPTTTDNCVGTVTGTTTDPLIYSSQGTFTVHWSFNDGNGNTSTANQTVIVDDVTAPVAPTIADATGECLVTVTAPTTTDNCVGTVTGTTTDPLTYSSQGTFTVHWTFDDGNGNTSTANQTVIVDDITAPVAPTIANATGECSVSVTAPTATDNCVGSVTGTTVDPLTYSSQGTFTVHWSFNDGKGNTSTANQTVIVDDITAPVAPTIANATGECSVTVTAPTATDNCVGSVIGTTSDPLTYNSQGTFTVHWSFNDGNGNTSTANQTVIVDDITAPVAPTIANATGECSVTVTAPTATDNCVGSVTGTTVDPLTYSSQGTFTVHWSFNDGNGNTSTANQTVIVDDITAPVAPTIANATGECSVTVTAPTATDNCVGSVIGTTSDPLTYNSQGTFTIHWSFDDGNGNTSTANQTVIVDDITAPVAPTIANATGECSVSVTAPTATDNCVGSVTGTTVDPLTYSSQGTFTVHWSFNDGKGNTSTANQTVIVDDITAPVAPTIANATGECSVTVTAPTATDNCVGSVIGTTSDPLTYNSQGTFIVHWSFDDGNGNTSTANQTVNVDDVTAPVAPTIANATGECSVTVTAPTATDNCVGSVVGTTSDPLTYNSQGTFTVHWSFNDGNGNTSTANQTVIVDDITAPVAPTIANATGECSVTVTAPTATDNCVGSVTGTTVDPLTYSSQGTFTVHWSFNDGNGNTSTANQTVIVDDITAPVAPTIANATGECSVTVTAPTAPDNCAGTITGTTSDPLTYDTQGTFTVHWSFNDGNGNTSTANQTVIVDDVTAPVAPTIANATGECSVTVTGPTATDNCVGSVIGTTSDPLTYNSQGTFTVHWSFNDGNGNTSTANQTVIVDDVTAPVAPTIANATGECSVTVTAPTATDNCVGSVVGTTSDPLTYNSQGTFTVHWSFNDGNGNTSTANQTVIVDDITAPVAPTIANATGECSVTVTAPTATDNCVGSVTGTTVDPLTYSSQGTFTVHWSFNDGNGNTSTANQTVIVDDVTAPVAPTIANATGECSVTVTAPTAPDNCAGTITGTTVDPLTYSSQGTFTVHWSFNDGNGNISTANQTVIVDDVTAPVAPTIANATGECSVTVTAPTAPDNCAGTITGTTVDPLTYSSQGTFSVHWSFNDGNGNTSTANQTVIVDDVTAPVAPTIANATGECSVTVTAPTAPDNCAGTITGTTSDPLTYSSQGTFTVHWGFNDGNGNISTANQTVIVDDVTAPVAPTIANATGECSVTVTAPTAPDNCAGTITGTTVDPLTYSSQGTFTVHWSFNDGNGNISTANQTVIVDDVTAPVAPTIANATGECSVTVTAPSATDNCVGSVVGTTVDPLTYSSQGTFTVHWSFNDGNGNTSTANQTVIVDDVTAPVAPTIANATGECSLTVTAPTATDNCVGSVTGTTVDPLTYSSQGTFTVHWSFNDGNGNTSTANQTVIVDDITAPVAPTIANATGECSVTVTAPTAPDNCAGTITGTTVDPLTYSSQGTFTVHWGFNDGNGNISTANQTVIVDDVTAPVAPTIANATGECSVTVTAPTAPDNCAGTITGTTVDPLTYNTQGTFTVHWSFNDGNGNTSTANQTVIVDDVTAPVAPTIANATGECSVTVTAPTAPDNCAGTITGTTVDPLTYSSQGTFTVHWSFNDGNGNISTANQTVIVDDVTAPVAPTIANATGECSVTVTAPSATDNCVGSVVGTTVDPLTYSSQGTFTVHWSFNDGNGNTSTANQTVIVDDVTAPVAPTIANATGECSLTVTAPTATDNCVGNVTGTTVDPLTYSSQGTFTVHWSFNDGNGNTSTANQTVIVDDITAPVAPTIANATGKCSVTVTAPTATDNCVGSVVGTTSDPLTYNSQGTFTVHWSFNDGNGNTSTANQTVIVDDITAPVAPTIANATGECSVTVTAPTATDNCVGSVIGTTSDPLTYNSQGTFTVHWSFNDGKGNTSTANQTVIVYDVTAPDITCPGNVTGNSTTGVATFVATATDNCGTATVNCYTNYVDVNNKGQEVHSGDSFPPGTTTVKVEAVDAAGNVATCQFTVTVAQADTQCPVVTNPLANPSPAAKGTPVVITATVSDVGTGGSTITSAQYSVDGGPWLPMAAQDSFNSATEVVTVTRTFTNAGVYNICIRGTDSAGNNNCAANCDLLVVIYDPSAGFVTGGGWIMSPLGAYLPVPSATGKANFGFVSKYVKGATIPTGETEFQFKAGSLNFNSAVYEWLVVSGALAQYKGSGTINGVAGYSFMLTAKDGQISGGGGVDGIRMKIWNTTTSVVVYDNITAPDGDKITAANAQALGGGSVVIHK